MLAPILISIFFTEFKESIELIQVISLAIIPSTIITTYTSKFLGMGKSKIVLGGSGLFLIIQIPLIIFLADMIGIMGAAIALVVATSIQAIYLIFIERIIAKK